MRQLTDQTLDTVYNARARKRLEAKRLAERKAWEKANKPKSNKRPQADITNIFRLHLLGFCIGFDNRKDHATIGKEVGLSRDQVSNVSQRYRSEAKKRLLAPGYIFVRWNDGTGKSMSVYLEPIPGYEEENEGDVAEISAILGCGQAEAAKKCDRTDNGEETGGVVV